MQIATSCETITVPQTCQTPNITKWRYLVSVNLLLYARGPFATVGTPLVSHITLICDDSKAEQRGAQDLRSAAANRRYLRHLWVRGLNSFTMQPFPRTYTATSDLVLRGS